ncbi:MAG TPA: cytochrome c biogenesis protein ResB [Nocardioidaceae bacterium]|nr:cytochrome c biogenesis protein ResB [Nocardioidaceae bacterium]
MTTTPEAPPLAPVELLRWAWRQLTSMRTALLLLLLLALAAVPGSVFPQQNIAPADVSRWRADHPTLAPIYDALGLFNVYSSVWFSAIYLLLAVSLVGCIVPRLRVYWRALRARPPQTPRNLSRLPSYQRVEVDEDPQAVLLRASKVLRGRRFRVAEHSESVSSERGYLREAGNLVFHLSVLVVLAGFAIGQLFGYTGGAIVLVGKGFSNSLTQYDEFAPGRLLDINSLAPVSFTVDEFEVEYLTSGPEIGQPEDFTARLTYTESPGADPKSYDLKVNHPLTLDGMDVFLVGNGYAPIVTVRDGEGDVAYRGPAVFLPQDSSFQSFGIIKVPDARPTQLGFEGDLYPTYRFTMETGPFSTFPDALDPRISLLAYAGDLGMDTGAAQNVFLLSKKNVELVTKRGKEGSTEPGDAFRIDLAPGEKKVLPRGLGSIEFDGLQRWVKLQVSDSPGEGVALGGVVAAILGLLCSLFIRPRRVWVRARREGGRTVVEVAGLDRSSAGEGLDDEVDRLTREITGTQVASMQVASTQEVQ